MVKVNRKYESPGKYLYGLRKINTNTFELQRTLSNTDSTLLT